MTPLQLQLENENLEGARLLLAAGANPTGASAALIRHQQGLVVLSEAALELIRVATHDAVLSTAVMDAPATPKVRI